MRTPALILAAALTAGCSTAEPPPPAPAAPSSSAPTRPDLYDEWAGRFDILTKSSGEPRCAGEKVRTKDCNNYLAPIAQTASALEMAIRERSDVASYVDTLVVIREVAFAREMYTELKCGDGGGTADACQREMLAISGGVAVLLAKLRVDELNRK